MPLQVSFKSSDATMGAGPGDAHRVAAQQSFSYDGQSPGLAAIGGRASLPVAALALLLGGCADGALPAETGAAPLAALTVQEAPFRVCLGEQVCTAAAGEHPGPLPYLYAEGPRPQLNPQTLAAFPAIGWVVGSTQSRVIPAFIWQGNRLSGVDSGTLYQVTEVAAIRREADRIEIDLHTDYAADPTPARLTARATPSGAIEIHVLPPPAMREAGIAVALFTLETPPGEGLFGLGARKDYFNQRGKLRNVWTEQQNTGLGSLDELDFAGAGLPLSLPTASALDALGLNPDVDDPALAEPRSTFPNGAQAAYWVEAFVVGSRGWAAWTTQQHFQRLDLAATRADRLRWAIVDSDEITLVLAGGGIENASRSYTAYWGRAPAPGSAAYFPWIDTLNQGEGEAAPNGQGFWGGQRARCEIETFIAKAAQYDLPLRLVGVEGWQVIPQTHPHCLAKSTAEICADPSGFPASEAAWQQEVANGTSFFNAIPACADADKTFFDSVRERGFELTGYWNLFHTNPQCPGDSAAGCADDTLSVPLASKQAYYAARDQYQVFVQSADGSGHHEVTTNRGGVSSIIDFTHPAAVPFWREQLARMFELGIAIFMHDFGELTSDDMAFAQGENLTESHNLYAWNYQRAARLAVDHYAAAQRGRPDAFAPFFYARAGMTGACAFTPGVFPGDESPSWDAGHGLPSVIPAMLNLALSGCYAFTTDVGGYFDFTAPRTAEDLFIRWSQLAALTPVMRIHNSTFNGSVFPWTWHEGQHAQPARYDTLDIYRRYARLKVNLVPLVEHWAERAAKHGDIGPVRPLILEDVSEAAQRVDYQWLLGRDLLVAPVTMEDATEVPVYFPAGARWRRVRVDAQGELAAMDEIYAGGATAAVAVTPDLADIPLFLRCGSQDRLLPVAGSAQACD